MPYGSVQNYQGSADAFDRIVLGGNVFWKCYNNTGSALTNGDIVAISGLSKNGSEAANTHYPTILAATTTAIPILVGVVDNSINELTTIADGAWGWVQVKGYCQAVTKTTTLNPIAIDDYFKVATGNKTADTDGTSGSTSYTVNTIGVAKSVVISGAAGTFTAYLFGNPIQV